ncbi:MAG: tRNA (N6-isopentenyl adenosine(37)-C2)-methylthiotransferase MiaB [Hydrogenobacter thermophilus]|uniref:tRNA (N6-isopentenyl adenosine(37)-C2)-methylthiotransferase MiaB n=1 Tax=Hydrogenobacter thermophilus TaxID=940 RepID=UPI001C751B8F|nr:tRNA (N6-isopentenyl adenosine(37)-C2)-methylthiotransferase MiaB [Hydrogenobacter thermophilus]QWK20082.1 MAG: tRNA (N6-isopentenyl adenosine(37)-C2)-methylthiotransferase MiaB [Hydrogenobacter thermophilus]
MKYYIKTFGCQMNFNDSERIKGMLQTLGYQEAKDWKEADIILINTCTIREKPDQKVFSHLGEYKKLKEQNPKALIGVCGCLAQRMGFELIQKSPVVDIMFSSFNMHQLPELIQQAQAGYKAVAILENPPDDEDKLWDYPTVRDNPYCAYVTVMKGCDKNCTYCVVPKTRGRQRSRSIESILKEVRDLVSDGVKEVHLLGQNVTAWGKDIGKHFSELLYRVAEIDKVERIRFTTGHPKDLDEGIAKAMGEVGKVCEHIHLPFQAGSDRILKLMDRGYTKEEYLEKISMLKEYVKGITFSTDVIVGFPTETEEDFEETLDVLKKVRFEQVFSFKFSPRPDTPAYSMEGQVPDQVKTQRMSRLLQLQKEIMGEVAKSYEGTLQEVLIESIEHGNKLIGRTRSNRWASMEGGVEMLGKVVKVKVIRSYPFNMECELV